MNRSLNPAAQIYVAELWGKIIGFVAILHFPHPKARNLKKITRVVVLPDYQGIGIGKVLINFVAKFYTNLGFRVSITTSHPAINKSLKLPWNLVRQGRTSSIGKTSTRKMFGRTISTRRYTCSWEYKPKLLINQNNVK
jgi:GNAT superfamily N-acetyltransferase